MDSPALRLFSLMETSGIKVTLLQNESSSLFEKWEEHFASGLSKSQKRKLGFYQTAWNMYAFEKVECLKERKAIEKFGEIRKQDCFIFFRGDEAALLVRKGNQIKVEDLIQVAIGYADDLYVVDKEFSWTFAAGHEENIGPFFQEK